METKVCNICNAEKAISCFALGRNQCRECINKRHIEAKNKRRLNKPKGDVSWCAGHKNWLSLDCFDITKGKPYFICKACKIADGFRINELKQTNFEIPADYKKQCVDCKELKAAVEFGYLNQSPDKLRNICKECEKTRYQNRKKGYKTPTDDYLKICPKIGCIHEGKPLVAKDHFRHAYGKKDTYYAYCKDCEKEFQKSTKGVKLHNKAVSKYSKSDKGKSIREKSYQNNQTHIQARRAVRYAIERNQLIAANKLNCYDCALEYKQVQAHSWHHLSGYSKEHWFTIIQLCWHHHVIRDTKTA